MLPKALLHVHLESAMRASTVAELARRYGVAVPVLGGPFAGFREFADRGSAVRGLLREAGDFARVAEEFCVDQAADGVGYVEVTFTAASHGERVGDVEMPLAAVVEGLGRGCARTGLVVRVVLDHSRRRSVGRLAATVGLAERFGEWVVGVGVAGEERYPLAPFAGVLGRARELGLRMVHHAGEQCGAWSVAEAVRVGCADRVGHGLSVLEDVELVAEVRDRGVGLEVCPASNVELGLVGSVGVHPLPRLLEAGLVVSLNTDVPAMTGVSLSGEFALVRSELGFSDGELAGLARAGVESSFAPAVVKERLVGGIGAWLAG
ncbi:adenosine deaminase [Actinokineospora spheciospongiae]|uniref:adenosine deaminase n=2 Tax=Actinokineospora spheciospongiae TaxID=909613 RepID=UPI002D799EDC|nr:adenosine deaminase [Actinokineospora spheciospongiae]